VNTETTDKTIDKIEREQTHTLTISQTLDLVRSQRSKTEFFVYAKVRQEANTPHQPPRQQSQHYECAVQVTRTSLIEMLTDMAARMRGGPTVQLTVALHANTISGYSAFYLC